MIKFMNSAEDLQWARDVHGVPANAQCIVLCGPSEDSPTTIDCYKDPNPKVTDEPFQTLKFGTDDDAPAWPVIGRHCILHGFHPGTQCPHCAEKEVD